MPWGPNRGPAAELAKHYTVFNCDRQGRGESGNTPPYSPDREEVEDLLAVIGARGRFGASVRHLLRQALAPELAERFLRRSGAWPCTRSSRGR